MAYSANEHGWNPQAFQSRCSGYGAAVSACLGWAHDSHLQGLHTRIHQTCAK